MANNIYSDDFVVRDTDKIQILATRFCNVLDYRGNHGNSNDISQILLTGNSIIIKENTLYANQILRNQNTMFDWSGSWRLQRLIGVEDEFIFRERQGDDIHECESRIPDFNNHQSLIQKNLGPIFLRYYNHDIMSTYQGEYNDVFQWVQRTAKWNLEKALSDKKDWIKGLNNHIDDFLTSYDFPQSGKIVIISAPLGEPDKPKSAHKEHLGYRLGELVASSISTNRFNVEQIMSFDLYENTFPHIKKSKSWKLKAKMKQGRWIDVPKNNSHNLLARADLVIIVDDTMISYATQLRISLTVRKYNKKCGILCAGVFAISGNSYGNTVRDTPDDIYEALESIIK